MLARTSGQTSCEQLWSGLSQIEDMRDSMGVTKVTKRGHFRDGPAVNLGSEMTYALGTSDISLVLPPLPFCVQYLDAASIATATSLSLCLLLIWPTLATEKPLPCLLTRELIQGAASCAPSRPPDPVRLPSLTGT